MTTAMWHSATKQQRLDAYLDALMEIAQLRSVIEGLRERETKPATD